MPPPKKHRVIFHDLVMDREDAKWYQPDATQANAVSPSIDTDSNPSAACSSGSTMVVANSVATSTLSAIEPPLKRPRTLNRLSSTEAVEEAFSNTNV